jgi:multidrug efflux system outer membrane protein
MKRSVYWALLVALLPGCRTMGPAYHRPGLDVPEAHRDALQPGSAEVLSDAPWWEVFHDPALETLVKAALEGNQDLRIAAARVDEARAGITVARSEGALQADADVSAAESYRSAATSGGGLFDRRFGEYRAAVGASWEIDLWGRIRRGSEAACADYLATEDGRRAVLVALIGDVAAAYFELRALDWSLEIAQHTLETRTSTRDLFAKRQEGGLGSELEVARAAGDLAGAAADVPALQALIAQRENALSFLLGRNPGPIPRGPALADAVTQPEVPAGLPSSLLERRPDVRAAEDALWAATARIGVARANRFPRVSLTGALGLESNDLSDLVSKDADAWSVGAGLLAPLLNGGRLKAEERAAWARACQAEGLWVKAAQGAFRDVADALVAVRRTREVTMQQRLQVDARRRSLELAWTRFRGEVASYFEVLDSQRELYPAELLLARARRDELLAVVTLYRSLGGGWEHAKDAGMRCTVPCEPCKPVVPCCPTRCPGSNPPPPSPEPLKSPPPVPMMTPKAPPTPPVVPVTPVAPVSEPATPPSGPLPPLPPPETPPR